MQGLVSMCCFSDLAVHFFWPEKLSSFWSPLSRMCLSGSHRILFYMEILFLCRKVLCGFKETNRKGSEQSGTREKANQNGRNEHQKSEMGSELKDFVPWCLTHHPRTEMGMCVSAGDGTWRLAGLPAAPPWQTDAVIGVTTWLWTGRSSISWHTCLSFVPQPGMTATVEAGGRKVHALLNCLVPPLFNKG